jgi:predicted nucleotidyltransferase component of viral defense system
MSTALDKQLHNRQLITLLSGIVRVIPEKLAFKGGTCAMLFYDLPRFSFDLDFDILRPLDKKDIDTAREILSNYGQIRDEYDKEHTFFFLFDYGKEHKKIKIEMNKRIWKNNVYKNTLFMGLPLAIQDESTLFTNKLAALSDRKNPVARDLFDAWFFMSKGFFMSGELIKERTGKSADEYLCFLLRFIEKVYTKRNILQGLGEVLDEKQKIWAKNHLIEDATRLIKDKYINQNLG